MGPVTPVSMQCVDPVESLRCRSPRSRVTRDSGETQRMAAAQRLGATRREKLSPVLAARRLSTLVRGMVAPLITPVHNKYDVPRG